MEGKIGIYVSLDALFDTRLATIYKIAPDKVQEILATGYLQRNYDEFEGVDTEVYQRAYRERDAMTIANSVITDAPRMIKFFAEQTLKARVGTPFRMQPVVRINIHPYKLPEAAITSIIQGVRILTENLIDIEIIDIPLSELTPKHVKDNYATLVMYEYWEWLECHSENKNLATTFCPEITLIAPAIVRSKEAWNAVKDVDVYGAIEEYSSMFIKLNLYPVSAFSGNIQRKIETQEKENDRQGEA